MSLANLTDADGLPDGKGETPPPGAWTARRAEIKAKAEREQAERRKAVLDRIPAGGITRARLAAKLEQAQPGVGWAEGLGGILEDLRRRDLAHEVEGAVFRGADPSPRRGPPTSDPELIRERLLAYVAQSPGRWWTRMQLAGEACSGVPLADTMRVIDQLHASGELVRENGGVRSPRKTVASAPSSVGPSCPVEGDTSSSLDSGATAEREPSAGTGERSAGGAPDPAGVGTDSANSAAQEKTASPPASLGADQEVSVCVQRSDATESDGEPVVMPDRTEEVEGNYAPVNDPEDFGAAAEVATGGSSTPSESLGVWIRRRRTELGLSQTQLARAAGISSGQGVISQLELGTSKTTTHMDAFERVLGPYGASAEPHEEQVSPADRPGVTTRHGDPASEGRPPGEHAAGPATTEPEPGGDPSGALAESTAPGVNVPARSDHEEPGRTAPGLVTGEDAPSDGPDVPGLPSETLPPSEPAAAGSLPGLGDSSPPPSPPAISGSEGGDPGPAPRVGSGGAGPSKANAQLLVKVADQQVRLVELERRAREAEARASAEQDREDFRQAVVELELQVRQAREAAEAREELWARALDEGAELGVPGRDWPLEARTGAAVGLFKRARRGQGRAG